MKSLLATLLVTTGTICFFDSCKNMEETSNMPQIQQMKDTIFATFNSTGSVWIDIKDQTDLVVVLGDAKLYNASADDKKAAANKVTNLALRLLGKDNKLEKSNLVLTKDIKSETEHPADAVTIPVNLDSLKKLMGYSK